jgi:CIC family chloride channel protein
VIESYHRKQGAIRARVPLIKILASAITLGTGGSGGREGPIAQIGAGFGSFLGGILGLSPSERRILVAAGMGAGIAAIFRAPLAGALFAAEVLYWSPAFEAEVILPAGLASVVAYSVFGSFFGWQTLFAMPDLTFDNAWQLGPYFLLVVVIVFLASLYVRTFYATTRAFHGLAIPRIAKPCVGALLTAVVGIAIYYLFGKNPDALAVLSYGYQAIQQALEDGSQQTAAMLFAIALGKIVTTSLTIGSGGSGGVFGPSMVIGGCAGGAIGLLFHQWWPDLTPHPASFVVVGMAGFFAAAAKTPFSTVIIVSEMTGGYHLLLPALWVCVLAFMLSDSRSLYTAQVENRWQSPAHRGSYLRNLLAGMEVNQLLSQSNSSLKLRASDSLHAVLHSFEETRYTLLPVVGEGGELLGVVSVEDAFLAARSPVLDHLVVTEDLMRNDVTPLVLADTIDRALERFVEHDVLELPVIETSATPRFVGMVRRFDVTNVYIQQLHEPQTKVIDVVESR